MMGFRYVVIFYFLLAGLGIYSFFDLIEQEQASSRPWRVPANAVNGCNVTYKQLLGPRINRTLNRFLRRYNPLQKKVDSAKIRQAHLTLMAKNIDGKLDLEEIEIKTIEEALAYAKFLDRDYDKGQASYRALNALVKKMNGKRVKEKDKEEFLSQFFYALYGPEFKGLDVFFSPMGDSYKEHYLSQLVEEHILSVGIEGFFKNGNYKENGFFDRGLQKHILGLMNNAFNILSFGGGSNKRIKLPKELFEKISKEGFSQEVHEEFERWLRRKSWGMGIRVLAFRKLVRKNFGWIMGVSVATLMSLDYLEKKGELKEEREKLLALLEEFYKVLEDVYLVEEHGVDITPLIEISSDDIKTGQVDFTDVPACREIHDCLISESVRLGFEDKPKRDSVIYKACKKVFDNNNECPE